MSTSIAIAGKGGTGKSSFTALLISKLVRDGKGPILAVDADPNTNLNDLMGLKVDMTIGDIRERVQKSKGVSQSDVPKTRAVELDIQEAVIESKGFDMIAMGRQEGPGCYCYLNSVLRHFLDNLGKSYRYIIVDNEAGMEHLSRRTTNEIDHLIIISDATPVALRSAFNIHKLARGLGLEVGAYRLVLNRHDGTNLEPIMEEARGEGMEVVGSVPFDEELAALARESRPITELPDDSPAAAAVRDIAGKLGI